MPHPVLPLSPNGCYPCLRSAQAQGISPSRCTHTSLASASGHARLTSHGIWALNEKGLVSRAGLEEATEILAAVGSTPRRLQDPVARMRHLLFLGRPRDLALDDPVRTDATEN
jgi:hypothetical protein